MWMFLSSPTIAECIILLLVGVGVFIAGMNMMGDGLQHSAGKGMKKMFNKISNNRIAGVGIGATITGIIQSSSATTVMVIGFVNAGVITLIQATSIIMGANIGTTVTGILVSLSSLNISLYASLLAFIGVMMTFFANDNVKKIGSILCGLGLIFVGLDMMSDTFKNNLEIKTLFQNLISKVDFPFLLIVIGSLFTALMQSSSAATGIVIIMAGNGIIPLSSALFIVLGSNIGTCITAILASIGANMNSKRAALIHLMFNVIGTIIFATFIWIFTTPIVNVLQGLIGTVEMQIAWFHVIFNVTTTLLLLPFAQYLVKAATLLIKEKEIDKEILKLRFVDERLLKTPSIALMQVKKEVEYMSQLAKENLELSYKILFNYDEKIAKEIALNENIIDFTNEAVTKYLIQLTSLVNESEEKVIGSYFHVLNDVERIGDHAENFMEMSKKMFDEEIKFSEIAIKEMDEMYNKVVEMFDISLEIFDNKDFDSLSRLNSLEEEVDQLKKQLSNQHFDRIADGTCKLEHSSYFTSIVSAIERIGDHLTNVGFSIENPTGSQD